MVMPVEYFYACVIMHGYKTFATPPFFSCYKTSRQASPKTLAANCKGSYLAMQTAKTQKVLY